ncbi:MAG: zinc ribbon domain-containing protein [Coriobacteriia bacterium]|nr:zinc ribbon domain-containing protein [Coriobacteriia bacterium]MDZ4166193.1 zinc ribbon domain-containing protein [Coriobacteriia bacterium]
MGDRDMAFCTACGAQFTGDETFCTRCGTSRSGSLTAPAAAPASAPTLIQQAGQVTGTARQAYGAVAQVAAVGGMAASLPWQTIVAGETPDLRGMLSRVAMPGARTLAQRSLKKPGLAMAVTTALDLIVAGLSGGGSALVGALPRALAGGTTALLSLITGSKGGALRGLTGVVSLGTALVQVISLGVTLIGGVRSGMPLLSTLPMVVAMASALVMALKTASVALRRRS